ncbi:hypothetical protein FACS1894199_14010 [Bacteroidia bacterium]|nr:hypothetical protein AGMMS4957_12720 [Bacteroidia bacterium]GHV67809.1 hypothetical protein FACS1894199_14010 [Bacteroidia bacterium]
MEQKEWTLKERLATIVESIELEKAGQPEEARRVRVQVPLSPDLAKWWKEKMGVEALLQQGYNLSDAEAEYGKDWLTR